MTFVLPLCDGVDGGDDDYEDVDYGVQCFCSDGISVLSYLVCNLYYLISNLLFLSMEL